MLGLHLPRCRAYPRPRSSSRPECWGAGGGLRFLETSLGSETRRGREEGPLVTGRAAESAPALSPLRSRWGRLSVGGTCAPCSGALACEPPPPPWARGPGGPLRAPATFKFCSARCSLPDESSASRPVEGAARRAPGGGACGAPSSYFRRAYRKKNPLKNVSNFETFRSTLKKTCRDKKTSFVLRVIALAGERSALGCYRFETKNKLVFAWNGCSQGHHT